MQAPRDIRSLLSELPRHEAEAEIQAGVQFVPMGPDRILCRILGRYKFFVGTNDIGFAPHVILDGFWEFWLTKFTAANVHPGDTAIDIGANAGYYSVLLSALVESEGRVTAVEPNANICGMLRDSLAVNGFAAMSDVRNVALFDNEQDQLMDFFVPTGEPKNGRLVLAGESVRNLQAYGTVSEVLVTRLSVTDFRRVDFIKIDVEGAEIEVLDSIATIIEEFDPIVVCEINFGRGYSYDTVAIRLGQEGQLTHLDFDGETKPLTREMVTSLRLNQDWLVVRNRRLGRIQ